MRPDGQIASFLGNLVCNESRFPVGTCGLNAITSGFLELNNVAGGILRRDSWSGGSSLHRYRRNMTWTFVGKSGQFPLGKLSVKTSTAFSDAVPPVVANTLSLRHMSPDAVR
jgi:hypothetical protein